jgi:hypothetical protein
LKFKFLEGFMKKWFSFGAEKDKVFAFSLFCAVLALVMGCTSVEIVPIEYTNNVSTPFEILGEVQLQSQSMSGQIRIGYIELLAAARRIYPDCDYVIDIMIDGEKTEISFLFWHIGTKTTYRMRGTAIKYIL